MGKEMQPNPFNPFTSGVEVDLGVSLHIVAILAAAGVTFAGTAVLLRKFFSYRFKQSKEQLQELQAEADSRDKKLADIILRLDSLEPEEKPPQNG